MVNLRLGTVIALALPLAGCALPGGFGDFFGKVNKSDTRAYSGESVTGTVSAVRAEAPVDAGVPSEADLTVVRVVAVDVLGRNRKDVSAPWENPASGARGTVTPIASAYRRDGAICHDILVSYVLVKASERWLQGQACRANRGAWEIKALRPWTQS